MSILYSTILNDSPAHHYQIAFVNRRQKSPNDTKQQLIAKIKALAQKNSELEIKQENLQNTVYDLKKLIELTNRQGQQMLSYVHKEVKKMQQKKASYVSGLYYGLKNDKHFQKCMLFWNQFL